jgi:hypothetical protein
MKSLFSDASIRLLSPWLLVLVCAAISVGIYLQALSYPFVSDDMGYITHNTKLAALHLTQLWRLFAEPFNTFSEFLPLRELSYWSDITLFGLNPAAFRLHNIILYLLCFPLVYATTLELWRYFRPVDAASAPWVATAVTALFALHPSHAEAVVWIAGRKDVLSTLFSLLALWLAMSARRALGLSVPYATATLLALLASMLSKASAVAVAPVIVLLWVMFWREIPTQERRKSSLLWPLAGLLLAACCAIIFATITTQRVPFYFGIEIVTRALAVLGWLARLSISPESRHFYYPVLDDPNLPFMVALGGVVLATATAGAMMILRKRSLEGFALAAFFLLCVPSLQLIPYSPPSLVSDRWLALAMWPVLLLIVSFAWRLKTVPRVILLLAFALPFGFQATARTSDWSSEDSLYDADMRAYPGYFMPVYAKICIQVFDSPESYGRALKMTDNITNLEAKGIIVSLVNSDRVVFDSISKGDPKEAIAQLQSLGDKLKHPPVNIKWNSPVSNLWRDSREKLSNLWKYLMDNFPGNELVHYSAVLHLHDVANE